MAFGRLYKRKGGKTLEPDGIGVNTLYKPENGEIDVDIVAIHGLNGHAVRTWTSTSPEQICWLKHPEFLPHYVPRSRILTWGYNANLWSKKDRPTSSDGILQHAHTLIADLVADRLLANAIERPIIFICHSLGGIILKRALIYSRSRTDAGVSHLHSIFTCTYAISFFGTPHHGTDKAEFAAAIQRIATAVVPKSVWHSPSRLLKALKRDSDSLQNISDQFAGFMKNFRLFYLWEQRPTNLVYTQARVVDENSAAPNDLPNVLRCGVSADHCGMVRFDRGNINQFQLIAAYLQSYVKDAPEAIHRRSARALETFIEARQFEAFELCQSQQPNIRYEEFRRQLRLTALEPALPLPVNEPRRGESSRAETEHLLRPQMVAAAELDAVRY